MYTKNEPKYIEAEKVTLVYERTVNVVIGGMEFTNLKSYDEPTAFDKSYVLVEHPKKGWLHVWFYDKKVFD